MPTKKKGAPERDLEPFPHRRPPIAAVHDIVRAAAVLGQTLIDDPEKRNKFLRQLDSVGKREIERLEAEVKQRTGKAYDRWEGEDEVREVPVERRGGTREPSPRHIQVPENLIASVSVINDLVRLRLVLRDPQTVLLVHLREMCESIEPAARRELVEHILRTPREGRERFLLRPGEPAPEGWGIVAESAALCLLADEVVKNGAAPWVRQVLDSLRGPLRVLPPPPPLQARPEWYPASHLLIQVVAAILATTPGAVLKRLRGCRYPPRWTNPHQCSGGLAPYFIDKSPGSSKEACCPTHRTKSLS